MSELESGRKNRSLPGRTTYAECSACHQSMNPGTGCTVVSYNDLPEGPFKRIPFGEETRFGDEAAMVKLLGSNWREIDCGDCNCSTGQLHHPGCDIEECPRCHRQAIGCSCASVEEVVNG